MYKHAVIVAGFLISGCVSTMDTTDIADQQQQEEQQKAEEKARRQTTRSSRTTSTSSTLEKQIIKTVTSATFIRGVFGVLNKIFK